jgi:hypothetical protein
MTLCARPVERQGGAECAGGGKLRPVMRRRTVGGRQDRCPGGW